MERTEQHNVAGRLHAILARAQKHLASNSGLTALALWAEVFEIPLSGPVSVEMLREVVSRILQLDKLIDETQESLHRIEGLPERYFRPFTRIRDIPKQSLTGLTSEIGGTVRAITEGDMTC